MLKFELRPEPSVRMRYLSPLVAAVLMLVSGLVVFSALGRNPWHAFYAYFIMPVSTLRGVGELFLKASPMMLCGIGLAIGFRANVWNIGAEGQLTMGALAASGLALLYPDTSSHWLLPGMIVAGMLGGMLWAAIPAFLRTRFNTNEILVSLMLTYIALLVLSWLVHGPWRDPEGYNFPQSRQFADAALFPILVAGTRINASLLIAFAAIAAGWVFISRSFLGYQMQVAGLADLAARYAGFSSRRMVWVGMLIGGATAGLAGVGEVAGPIGQLLPNISPGYGFASIIVAFIGRLHPLGILLGSLLMSLLYLGGDSAQINLSLPSAITGLFQGMLLFYLLASDVFINYRIRFKGPRASANTALEEEYKEATV